MHGRAPTGIVNREVVDRPAWQQKLERYAAAFGGCSGSGKSAARHAIARLARWLHGAVLHGAEGEPARQVALDRHAKHDRGDGKAPRRK